MPATEEARGCLKSCEIASEQVRAAAPRHSLNQRRHAPRLYETATRAGSVGWRLTPQRSDFAEQEVLRGPEGERAREVPQALRGEHRHAAAQQRVYPGLRLRGLQAGPRRVRRPRRSVSELSLFPLTSYGERCGLRRWRRPYCCNFSKEAVACMCIMVIPHHQNERLRNTKAHQTRVMHSHK